MSAPASLPTPDLRAWRRLAGRVFADLGRVKITSLQALIFERYVRVTLAVGRQSVRVPRLEMFGRFRLSKGKVSEAHHGSWQPNETDVHRRWVPGLVELGMLRVVKTADGGVLVTVLPNTAATPWKCEWRFHQRDDDEFLAHLDAVASQVQPELFPRELELPDALALTGLEAGLRSRFGNAETPAAAGRVPDSGTSRAPGSPGGSGVPNEETFNRFGTKRLNVPDPGVPVVLQEAGRIPPSPTPTPGSFEDAEKFAQRLRERVRRFVGESDWMNERWWNQGRGYRAQFFRGPDAVLLDHVVGYCARWVEKGEVMVKRTRGALLWWEFSEARRKAAGLGGRASELAREAK